MPKAASTNPRDGKRRKTTSGSRGSGARRDQEVLDAASRVFHSRGYADASVQDIADELGILKGSLYHYIDSKEDLLYRLLAGSHEEVERILDEVLALQDTPPLERLRAYVTRQVEYTSRNLAKMAIYYHDVDQLGDERRRELLRKRRVHEKFVTSMIEQGQESGDVAAGVDPQLATNYLFGSMIWVYRWYKPGGKLKSGDLASTCADFVMAGVTGPRPA